ncbi:hypothetical protein JTB14_012040 [Gonioctena quinquepunctata]|nr:hypothetical protein JTB14_012040 [Gonioctena quinquepunctata]
MDINNDKRGSNFTPEEINVLIKLANKHKKVIENKKTDGTTWKSKEEAWKEIQRSFNSCSNGPPRTFKQLKMKYEGIKKDMKKKMC